MAYMISLHFFIANNDEVYCKKNSVNIIAFMIELLEAMIHFSKL